MNKTLKPHFNVIFSLFGLLVALLFVPTQIAEAASPIVVVAKWNKTNQCVQFAYGAYDVDTFTRDALAGEWYSFDPVGSLRAGAILIRSNAVYYSAHPEWTDSTAGFVCGNAPRFYFNLRTSIFSGWGPGKGATNTGLANNVPNDQVTVTGGQVLEQNNSTRKFPAKRCHHDEINRLVAEGVLANYREILTDRTRGLYRADTPCRDSDIPGLAVDMTNYGYTQSMVNGTAAFYTQGNQPPFQTSVPNGGARTDAVTAEGVSRQAESYWGFVHMVSVGGDPHPEPEPGTYIKGTGKGDKVEYLYSFGGHTNTLRISGIDDHPAPVRVNIYIDGKFVFEMNWVSGDDTRRQISRQLTRTWPAATHAVAIEFVEDYFVSGCAPDNPEPCDRNLFLDNFLITSP
jgi:hypothetical protein